MLSVHLVKLTTDLYQQILGVSSFNVPHLKLAQCSNLFNDLIRVAWVESSPKALKLQIDRYICAFVLRNKYVSLLPLLKPRGLSSSRTQPSFSTWWWINGQSFELRKQASQEYRTVCQRWSCESSRFGAGYSVHLQTSPTSANDSLNSFPCTCIGSVVLCVSRERLLNASRWNISWITSIIFEMVVHTVKRLLYPLRIESVVNLPNIVSHVIE